MSLDKLKPSGRPRMASDMTYCERERTMVQLVLRT